MEGPLLRFASAVDIGETETNNQNKRQRREGSWETGGGVARNMLASNFRRLACQTKFPDRCGPPSAACARRRRTCAVVQCAF